MSKMIVYYDEVYLVRPDFIVFGIYLSALYPMSYGRQVSLPGLS